jgi:hypothetical protein
MFRGSIEYHYWDSKYVPALVGFAYEVRPAPLAPGIDRASMRHKWRTIGPSEGIETGFGRFGSGGRRLISTDLWLIRQII